MIPSVLKFKNFKLDRPGLSPGRGSHEHKARTRRPFPSASRYGARRRIEDELGADSQHLQYFVGSWQLHYGVLRTQLQSTSGEFAKTT